MHLNVQYCLFLPMLTESWKQFDWPVKIEKPKRTFGRSIDVSDEDVVNEYIPRWTGFCVKDKRSERASFNRHTQAANDNVDALKAQVVLQQTEQVRTCLSNVRIRKHGSFETVQWDHGKFSFAKVC